MTNQNLTTMFFAQKLKSLREGHHYMQRQIAALLDIDTPMYSRIERGERFAKEEHIPQLAKFYSIDENELRQLWLADKVYDVIAGEEAANEVLDIVAESIVEYGKNKTGC